MLYLKRVGEFYVENVKDFAPGPKSLAVVGDQSYVLGNSKVYLECEALKASYHFGRFVFVGPEGVCVTDENGKLLKRFKLKHQIAVKTDLIHVSKLVAPYGFSEVPKVVTVASLVPYEKVHLLKLDLEKLDIVEFEEIDVEKYVDEEVRKIFYFYVDNSLVFVTRYSVAFAGRASISAKKFLRRAEILDADARSFPSLGDALVVLARGKKPFVNTVIGTRVEKKFEVECAEPRSVALAWFGVLLLCKGETSLWVNLNGPTKVYSVEGEYYKVKVEEPYVGLLGEGKVELYEVSLKEGLNFFDGARTLFGARP